MLLIFYKRDLTFQYFDEYKTEFTFQSQLLGFYNTPGNHITTESVNELDIRESDIRVYRYIFRHKYTTMAKGPG